MKSSKSFKILDLHLSPAKSEISTFPPHVGSSPDLAQPRINPSRGSEVSATRRMHGCGLCSPLPGRGGSGGWGLRRGRRSARRRPYPNCMPGGHGNWKDSGRIDLAIPTPTVVSPIMQSSARGCGVGGAVRAGGHIRTVWWHPRMPAYSSDSRRPRCL